MAIINGKNDKIHCLTVSYPLYIQWKSEMGDKSRNPITKINIGCNSSDNNRGKALKFIV